MDKDSYVKAAFKESEIYENIGLKKYWTCLTGTYVLLLAN